MKAEMNLSQSLTFHELGVMNEIILIANMHRKSPLKEIIDRIKYLQSNTRRVFKVISDIPKILVYKGDFLVLTLTLNYNG